MITETFEKVSISMELREGVQISQLEDAVCTLLRGETKEFERDDEGTNLKLTVVIPCRQANTQSLKNLLDSIEAYFSAGQHLVEMPKGEE